MQEFCIYFPLNAKRDIFEVIQIIGISLSQEFFFACMRIICIAKISCLQTAS